MVQPAKYTYTTILIPTPVTALSMTTALTIQGQLGWNLIDTVMDASGNVYANFELKSTVMFTSTNGIPVADLE